MIDTPNINEAVATVRQAIGELSTYGSHTSEVPTEMKAYKAFEYILATWERPDLLEMLGERFRLLLEWHNRDHGGDFALCEDSLCVEVRELPTFLNVGGRQ